MPRFKSQTKLREEPTGNSSETPALSAAQAGGLDTGAGVEAMRVNDPRKPDVLSPGAQMKDENLTGLSTYFQPVCQLADQICVIFVHPLFRRVVCR